MDPKNTPKWVNSIVREETNEWPVKVGTIYRNQNTKGEWAEYKVVVITSTMFEFVSTSSTYHVQYTVKSLTPDTAELEYFEWMEEGDIPEPFTLASLQKLKSILES